MGKTLKKKVRKKLAGREKGKRKGETSAPALSSFLPFYFRVCAFSIQRTRLSRSLELATKYHDHDPLSCLLDTNHTKIKTRNSRPFFFLLLLLLLLLITITKLQHKEKQTKKRFKESTVRLPKKDRSNKRTLIVYNQSDISS